MGVKALERGVFLERKRRKRSLFLKGMFLSFLLVVSECFRCIGSFSTQKVRTGKQLGERRHARVKTTGASSFCVGIVTRLGFFRLDVGFGKSVVKYGSIGSLRVDNESTTTQLGMCEAEIQKSMKEKGRVVEKGELV